MSTVAVLGGGISGLSAVYYLSKAAKQFKKIILLEGKSRLGGWLQTVKQADGSVFELGPRSIRPAGETGYNCLQLVEELGLSNEVIAIQRAHPANKKRLIYIDGSLIPLPGTKALFKKIPPFKKTVAGYLWRDWRAPKIEVEDESVESFVTRRLGKDVSDNIVDPLCKGIFAGKVSELSIRSCFPLLYKYEQDWGSIVKGVIYSRKAGRLPPAPINPLVLQAKSEQWAMWSFKNGLEQLVTALCDSLSKCPNVEIRTKTSCEGISFEGKEIKIRTKDEVLSANHLISSIYAEDFASLLPLTHSKLVKHLMSIPAVNVAIVHLEYKGDLCPQQAFGYLVPSSEKSKILGVVFDSCIFPQQNNCSEALTKFTVMLGGSWFEELFGNVDQVRHEMLLDVALDTMKKHLNIEKAPFRTMVAVHKNCIPQYKVGHHKILNQIDNYLIETSLPISLIGSSYRGVSVNECIFNAKQSVQKLIQ